MLTPNLCLLLGLTVLFFLGRARWLTTELNKYERFMPKTYRRITNNFLTMLVCFWVWNLEKFINYKN